MDRTHVRRLVSTGVIIWVAALAVSLAAPAVAGAGVRKLGPGKATFHLDGVSADNGLAVSDGWKVSITTRRSSDG